MVNPAFGKSPRRQEGIVRVDFKRLTEIDKAEIIQLMSHPLLRRQMPLLGPTFTEADCVEFIAAKERLWEEHGYGPWAILLDGHFVGRGGLQPENGDADLALVLHPRHWGIGKAIDDEIIQRAFGEMSLESVTVLLPPTRTRIRGILRLGFQPDGEVEIEGEHFIRLCLSAPA